VVAITNGHMAFLSHLLRARGSSHGPDVSETFSTRSYSSGVYSTAHKEIRVNASQSS